MAMKSLVRSLALVLASFLSFSASAVDRLVTEGGSGGGFSSINAAMTAAVDGDRIIVHPKAGNAPWMEDLTITKSLTFLGSNTDYWKLAGNVTVTPAAAGKVVTLVKMDNTTGYIRSFAAAPTGTRTKVNILNCKLSQTGTGGYIFFQYNNFEVTVTATEISSGYVHLRFGKILGNTIVSSNNTYAIHIGQDGTATQDTNMVIGNIITHNTNSFQAVWLNSSNQYIHYLNNVLTGTGAAHIYLDIIKTGSGENLINNNVFRRTTGGLSYGVYLAAANNNLKVLNNIFVGTAAGTGINNASGFDQVQFSFNQSNNQSMTTGVVNDGTNNASANNTFNADWSLVAGSTGIDAGHSGGEYSDLDLTRNDCGVHGGSFSQANFFPLGTTAPKVLFIQAPNRVVNGGTINIRSAGFAR